MRRRLAALAFVAATGAIAVPPPTIAQYVGLYLDPQATICAGPITYFESKKLYIAAYLPPDTTLIGGVLFSVQLPVQLAIVPGSVETSRLIFEVAGDLENLNDVDLTFDLCRQGGGPYVLAEFEVFEGANPARSDLHVRLIGAAIDSLAGVTPRLKVCDPNDPKSYLGFIDRPGVDAIFNCTQNCDCTTSTERRTWTHVKALYREP